MNAPQSTTAPSPWQVLASLMAKARAAESGPVLAFSMVNDAFALVPYRSALLLNIKSGGARLAAASGLSTVDRKSAYGSWVERVIESVQSGLDEGKRRFVRSDAPESLQQAWLEYWPELVHVYPVPASDGRTQAVVVYLTDSDWPTMTQPLLEALHQMHGLCIDNQRLRGGRSGWFRRGGDGRVSAGAIVFLVVLVLGIAALFVPIRQFVISPAEVVSLDSIAVTSPVEGIIGSLAVRPNQPVRKGDLLIRLDDTAVRNRLEAARQALEVARAEFLAGAHRSFITSERGAEVGVLRGRINERVAELAFLEEQLALLQIRASRDGIAVFGQVNDLIGKPVSPGMKVMELADPSRIGVNVWVPVADAINTRSGERVDLMLYADPLNPRAATIEQTSYQTSRSPDGVASHRVRAVLEEQNAAWLGLRGNARIQGETVSLGYFIFRRPILVVRQWLGV